MLKRPLSGLMQLAAITAAATATITTSMFRKGYGPQHTRPSAYRTIRRLNRSEKWKSARSYEHARSLSPFPERPVR